MSVAKNLQQVQKKIEVAARANGRDPLSIKLLAVSKGQPVSKIIEAYSEGQRCFGENYVQEFLKKYEQLAAQKIEWHFIGRLQSNKVKQIVGKCRLIQSVDRLSLAQEISRRAKELGIAQSILLQVNIGDEESKGGAKVADMKSLVAEVSKLEAVKIEGLMSLPPLKSSPEYFLRTKKLMTELKIGPELSMGTSADFTEAIHEGSTIVRIGTEIFGRRETN